MAGTDGSRISYSLILVVISFIAFMSHKTLQTPAEANGLITDAQISYICMIVLMKAHPIFGLAQYDVGSRRKIVAVGGLS
jgi:hypothetical protein